MDVGNVLISEMYFSSSVGSGTVWSRMASTNVNHCSMSSEYAGNLISLCVDDVDDASGAILVCNLSHSGFTNVVALFLQIPSETATRKSLLFGVWIGTQGIWV